MYAYGLKPITTFEQYEDYLNRAESIQSIKKRHLEFRLLMTFIEKFEKAHQEEEV